MNTVLYPPSDRAREAAKVEQAAADAALDQLVARNPHIPMLFEWFLTNFIGGGITLVISFLLGLVLLGRCSGCIIPLVWLLLAFAQWNILRRESSYPGFWTFVSVLPIFVVATVTGRLVDSGVQGSNIAGLHSSLVFFGFQLGLIQWYFFRKRLMNTAWWPTSSAAAWLLSPIIAGGILLTDRLLGRPWDIRGNIWLQGSFLSGSIIIGAMIMAGIAQWLILRRQSQRSSLWMFFNGGYWILAVLISGALANTLRLDTVTASSSPDAIRLTGFLSFVVLLFGSLWIILSGWVLTWVLPIIPRSLTRKRQPEAMLEEEADASAVPAAMEDGIEHGGEAGLATKAIGDGQADGIQSTTEAGTGSEEAPEPSAPNVLPENAPIENGSDKAEPADNSSIPTNGDKVENASDREQSSDA